MLYFARLAMAAAGNGSFNGKPKATAFSVLSERVGSKHSRLRLAVKRKKRHFHPRAV